MSLMHSKLGFYQIGDRSTFSKFEAVEWANGRPIHWNFNDQVFSSYDWTIEPTSTLWDLYKKRARQIREKYDYVVLWYSGGSDSHNLLTAWIEEGCEIDEIACTWNFETTGDLYNHQNSEITRVVQPHIEQLRDRGLKFKFRLLNMPDYSLKLFKKWGPHFEYLVNHHASINNPAKSLFREEVEDYRQMLHGGINLGFVWGVDKCFVNYHDNRFFCHFIDCIDNCVSPYTQNKSGWNDELFYWSPDFPLLPIKQAHVLKNFLQTCHDPRFYRDMIGSWYNPTIKKYLHIPAVKRLLYPKWSNKIFVEKRTSSYIYSQRDDWLWNTNADAAVQYDSVMNYYITRMENYQSEGIYGDVYEKKRIKPFYSKKYLLE